jgi:hypothetical protein
MGQNSLRQSTGNALAAADTAAGRRIRWAAPFMVGAWLLAASASALGQPDTQPPSGPPRSVYRADISYTGAGRLDAEAGRGDVDAVLARVSYTHRFRTGDNLSWGVGPVYNGLWLGADAGLPLPRDLHGLALSLSGQWLPADRWWVRLDVRPGIYSDWADISGRDFNAPALVAVGYQIRTNLMLVAGINVNLWSRLATIGGPGVIWQFAETWQLNLVLPKPLLEYAPNRAWAFYVGGEIQGGSYRLAEDFGNQHGRPELNGDTFAYREIRALGGVRWSVTRSLRLSVEAGYAADREFEFRDAGWEFQARGAPFVQALAARSF